MDCVGAVMNGAMHDFHVEVRDQEIVVTMPATA